MPTIYTPNVVQAEMVYVWNAQRMENVYNVQLAAPATLANLVALYDVFRLWELNTARSLRAPGCSLVLIVLRAMDGAGAPYYESTTNLPINATGAGNNNVSYISIAIRHSTGVGGRSYRGRSYWVAIPSSVLTAPDVVPVAYAGNLAAAYNTLRANLAAAGATFGVVSKYSGVDSNGHQIPRSSGLFTAITGSSCEVGLDTMRKRKLPYQR